MHRGRVRVQLIKPTREGKGYSKFARMMGVTKESGILLNNSPLQYNLTVFLVRELIEA